jgi:hypothetical protein
VDMNEQGLHEKGRPMVGRPDISLAFYLE